jgi:TIR domain
LFCSYSHRDEPLRDELAKHLKQIERQGLVRSWHDREISAGHLWKEAIDQNLHEADVILLLISADFLASDYCFDIEMKNALERHAAGEALVIPVILRPVDWRATPFSKLQALPKDGKPVTTFENLDSALEQVAQGIRRAIERLQEARCVPTARPQTGALPFPALPAASLDPIAKLLTLYIGPIASVVVRNASSNCHGVRELCEAVAAEIANSQDRSRFLSEAQRLSASGAIE